MEIKLTAAQMRDLTKIAANSGRGGVAARTGRALWRLGLVMHTPGYRPHGARCGWMTTPKGEAFLATHAAGREPMVKEGGES